MHAPASPAAAAGQRGQKPGVRNVSSDISVHAPAAASSTRIAMACQTDKLYVELCRCCDAATAAAGGCPQSAASTQSACVCP